MRFVILCLLACLGAPVEAQGTQAAPDALLEAGHCVASAPGDWLNIARDNPYTVELGYAAQEKAGSGGDPLYLIEFTTPTHSQGFAFVFDARGKGSHRELTLESRTGFRQTVDGTQRVTLVNPPLGGIHTEQETLAAIQKVGFHTWKVPVADLRKGGRSVSCKTAEAVR
jgi:hypothetical protein